MSEQVSSHDSTDGTPHRAGAFDIRNFIAALIGIYGVVLVLVGLFGLSDKQLAKSDDLNINLIAGIGMIVMAAIFFTWARLRPVVVPTHHDNDDRPSGH
jgi:hypothetical protein